MGVLCRHAYLAVDEQKFLLEKSHSITQRHITITSEKGQIVDRNGLLLAMSVPYYRFALNAKKHHFSLLELKKIATILNCSVKSIQEKIKNKSYVKIADRLSYQEIEALSALPSDGIIIEEQKGRYYPLGEKSAQLIGYVDIEGKGQLGLEYQFDEYMSGQDGKMTYTQNLLNQVTEVHHYQSPLPGQLLRLTIDYRLQYEAYLALEEAVKHHQADSASVVVLSVKTGEVMAMVNYPSFDPNQPIPTLDNRTKNKIVTDLIEPGSVIKPLALTAILENGDYDIHAEVETSGGEYEYKGWTFHDHKDMGRFSFADLLMKSSNIVMVKLVENLPVETLLEVYHRFGLFSPSFIQLPGETVGRHVPNPGKIDEAAMTYGYGLSVNVLSIAKAYNILANKGKDPGVHIVFEKHRPVSEQVVSEDVVSRIIPMMVKVTEEGISSHRAKVGNIKIAGKSGTVHKLDNDKQYKNEYIASFAGFGPSDDPEFVAVVVVDNPRRHGHFGGQVAAPIFAKVLVAAFHYRPDEE